MFKTLTVDSVLANFKDTIAKLEQVAERNLAIVNRNSETIANLTIQNAEAEAEVYRAKQAARKISDLLV